MTDYKTTYDMLYSVGYHDKDKNHGVDFAAYVYKNFRTKIKRIIEVGCSNGLAVKLLQRNHINAYGIDISNIAIHYASDQNGIINCIEGSAIDIPFKDNFFDSVFSCDMLEHLEPKDVDIALDEMSRVASKYLFLKISPIQEQNTEHLDKAIAKYGEAFPVRQLHLTLMPLTEWQKKIEQRGFELLPKKDYKGIMCFKRK